MSEIKVNKISPQSGTALEIGDSGDTIDLSAVTVTLPANSVNSDQYVDGSIDTIHIGDNQVTGAKLNPSLVAGDIIYADGTDTINRLAKGTAAQVLAMNAGATAPEWVVAAGGAWSVLTSGTFSGSSGLEFTGISKTTKVFLRLIIINGGFTVRWQASTDGGSSFLTGYVYSFNKFSFASDSYTSTNLNNSNSNNYIDTMTWSGDGTIGQEFTLHDPTSTSDSKMVSSITTYDQNGGTKKSTMALGTGSIETTSAVNALKVVPYAGTFTGVYTVVELN